ncbi:uncharacterized protein SCODWIG_03628 [Saccharomycodes ludwigii]|uniref:BRO1 domain-containing protein n=1 Tax=Saccharomycodes ludwigii TaxID=36035 RepID=A0A376BB62_9ASCO|nr:hypothetical protein SCDLUD_002212 [Saccharomycodes ludwigii]KAH3902391.1 hypothetical protein SCDLUD_002212 [Saccharomycodes ludwigii]SSD61867.1 uncharacterized protein SCODWIG_03628 [Saccharomycodes ludwigii]
MPDLLCIPFRKPLPLDLVQILSTIIDQSFYQSSSMFKNDLIQINDTRSKISQLNVSEQDLGILQKYSSIILRLIDYFPENPNLTFEWTEFLNPKPITYKSTSFSFEFENVLYNIACMYSSLGVQVFQKTNSESLKKCCHFFQLSAGFFENCTTNDSVDDDKETIQGLVYIMLAQAQEMVWLKSVIDGKLKDLTVAKLAFQVSRYYLSSLNFINRSSTKIIQRDWQVNLKSKMNYFEAIAYYRYALYLEHDLSSSTNYGLKIKCLRHCQALTETIKLPDQLEVENFVTIVNKVLKTFERDNDLIYLQNIPDALDSNLIIPMSMVKPINNISGITKSNHILQDLLPVSVLETATAFKKREREYVENSLINVIEQLSKLLNDRYDTSTLHSDIPVNFKEPLPKRTFFKIKDILQSTFPISRKEVDNILKEVSQMSDDIVDLTENKYRSRYGPKVWNLIPFKELNPKIFENLANFKKYNEQAELVDRITLETFEVIDQNLLCNPLLLPESTHPLFVEMNQIISERRLKMKEILLKFEKHSILPEILALYKKKHNLNGIENVYSDYLNFYNLDFRYVSNQKKINDHLIEKIDANAIVVDDNEENSRIQDPRNIFIEDYKHSYELFKQVELKIERGLKFYDDLRNNAEMLKQMTIDAIDDYKIKTNALVKSLS